MEMLVYNLGKQGHNREMRSIFQFLLGMSCARYFVCNFSKIKMFIRQRAMCLSLQMDPVKHYEFFLRFCGPRPSRTMAKVWGDSGSHQKDSKLQLEDKRNKKHIIRNQVYPPVANLRPGAPKKLFYETPRARCHPRFFSGDVS